MLIKLKIKNIALIEIIEINFEKGLNIITGDSGSGKSLILDSLNVLFGGTNIPSNHLIRPGSDDCFIEAKFSSSSQINNWLSKNGFGEMESDLIVKRLSFKKNKRIFSKYSLNDLPINKKVLEELGRLLIDFSGQSDSHMFNSHEYRRLIIDQLGSKELKETNFKIKSFCEKLDSFKVLLNEKKVSFKKKEEDNLAVKEMFNILDQANLESPNEIVDLELLEKRLSNNLEINNAIQASLNNLNNFSHDLPSVGSLVSQSVKNMSKVAEFDIKIQEFVDRLINIQNNFENLYLDLNNYIHQIESSDIALEDIQNRLFFLKNLQRTFSMQLPQLIEKRNRLKKHFLENVHDKEIKELEFQIKKLESNLNPLFILQSNLRKKIATQLQDSIMSILKNLGLKNAKFLIQFHKVNSSKDGTDFIEFLFSANPEQQPAPISKVISCGEMSRFLLAIKSSISKKANTFFLDEIDNGLSGKSLYSLVELIKKISIDQQVLCITHQPFLAAAGQVHFKVVKNVVDGLTYTSISKLITKKERQGELVELIGGGFGEANDYASRLLDMSAA